MSPEPDIRRDGIRREDVRRDDPAWAAIIVNYEAGPLLLRCVDSVLADAGGGAEVIVVDNGSTDGSARAVEIAYPEVLVVRPGVNLGYARAANLGVAVSRAPIVAVLNPDTVLRPGTAGALMTRLAGEPDLGAVGPRLLEADGSVYPSARSVPSLLVAVGHGLFGLAWPSNPFTRRYRQLDADPARPRDVDWVSGAAIWLSRGALDAIGGWDERYFMYVEDVDLCWRLRGGGWRVAYEPAGEVVHWRGVSTSRRPDRMIIEHHRSLWRFARRRFTGGRGALLLPPAAGFLAARAAATIVARRLQARSPGSGAAFRVDRPGFRPGVPQSAGGAKRR